MGHSTLPREQWLLLRQATWEMLMRALASEGVLDPKEHTAKLKQLHPDAPLPAVPDPVPKSRLTQPFNKADFHLVVKHAKWK